MKLGLAIQGPTRSRGLTPIALEARVKGDPVSDDPPMVVEYDVRERLQAMLDEHGHHFEKRVLATWEDQDVTGLTGIDIVKLPLIQDAIDQKQSLKRSLGLAVNKYRQFYSSLAAIEPLHAAGDIDAILRIRSDIDMDLAALADWMEQTLTADGNAERIFVPSVGYPDYQLTDFFFAGLTGPMHRLFDHLVRHPAAASPTSVHLDFLLRQPFNEGPSERLAAYPITVHDRLLPAATRNLIKTVFEQKIGLMPRRFSTSLHWRGVEISPANYDYVWPDSKFGEDAALPHELLSGPIDTSTRRRLLDVCFDYKLAAECEDLDVTMAGLKTFLSRLVVRFARMTSRG